MARLQQLSLLIVAVLLVVVADDSNPTTTAKPPKHPRCHRPLNSLKCQTSSFNSPSKKIVGWYFHAPFKSCKPLYATGGVYHCDEDRDLPSTREECEELCGEPCFMDNGTVGVCTFEEYCRNPPHSHTVNRVPCRAYGVNCCYPRPKKVIKLPYATTASPDNTTSGPETVNDVDYDSSDDQYEINGLDIHAGGRPKPLGLNIIK